MADFNKKPKINPTNGSMKRVKTDIESGSFAGVYLLFGEERYLVNQYRDMLINALVTDGDTMNFTSYTADRFDENAVLHVIYDSEGKVTMEVAAADDTDREPHPREVDTIVKEQEKFCDAYESVFERINEKGVSFRKEMMCPCGPEFAQVINVSEFEKSADEEAQTFDEMYADRKTKYLYVSR